MQSLDRLKVALRDAFSAALSAVPLKALEGIRRAYFDSAEGSLRRGLTRPVLRVMRYRAVDRGIAEFAIPDAPGIRLANTNSIIVRRAFWLGKYSYEGKEIDLWQRLCEKATGIVEIGANIGFYTVFGAKSAPSVPYLAVEPHPVSAAVLRHNVEINGLSNVTVLEAAVVGRMSAESLQLLTPAADEDEAPTGAFVANRSEVVNWEARASTRVEAVDAAAVLRGADVVKIDAEGMELELLEAVEERFLAATPNLLFEALPGAHALRRFVVGLMEQSGYRAFLPLPDNLIEFAPAEIAAGEPALSYGVRDVLLSAHPERFDLGPPR